VGARVIHLLCPRAPTPWLVNYYLNNAGSDFREIPAALGIFGPLPPVKSTLRPSTPRDFRMHAGLCWAVLKSSLSTFLELFESQPSWRCSWISLLRRRCEWCDKRGVELYNLNPIKRNLNRRATPFLWCALRGKLVPSTALYLKIKALLFLSLVGRQFLIIHFDSKAAARESARGPNFIWLWNKCRAAFWLMSQDQKPTDWFRELSMLVVRGLNMGGVAKTPNVSHKLFVR